MKDICLLSHIALNVEMNVHMRFFPFSLIAHELIQLSFVKTGGFSPKLWNG